MLTTEEAAAQERETIVLLNSGRGRVAPAANSLRACSVFDETPGGPHRP